MDEKLADLKEQYKAKADEMKEKYADVINEISAKHNVDVGVAFDMLKAVCRGGDYADGFEFDREALKKDYEELLHISDRIVALD